MASQLKLEDSGAVAVITSPTFRETVEQAAAEGDSVRWILPAGDGLEALEAVKNHAGPIDLLLTDVVMPHMHGPELAERLAASQPEIRVLYMSGYAQPMVDNGGTLEEGVLLIEKPFTEPVLLDGVEHALHASRVVPAPA